VKIIDILSILLAVDRCKNHVSWLVPGSRRIGLQALPEAVSALVVGNTVP